MRRLILTVALLALALVGAGCGEQDIQIAKDSPDYEAAVLFKQRCAGCHHLDAVGAEGSATRANSRERKDGPNFNVRAEDYDSVLYAIRNGGFSSGPMPQNIVVGEEAVKVSCFVAKYSGRASTSQRGAEGADQTSETPGSAPPTGESGDTGVETTQPDCP